jgi:hypothetical protein
MDSNKAILNNSRDTIISRKARCTTPRNSSTHSSNRVTTAVAIGMAVTVVAEDLVQVESVLV